MKSLSISGSALLTLALTACGGGGGSGTTPDAGGGPAPACEEAPQVCDYATDGYGTSVGETIQPFNLPQCDATCDAYPHTGLCESTDAVGTDTVQLTVLTIAAGWCVPCRNESAILSERLTDAFRGQGVEVIQVLTQKDDYNPVDATFCQGWEDTYSVVRPNGRLLMDPNGEVRRLWASGTLPVTYIVSNTGEILYKAVGANDELAEIVTQVETALGS